MTRFDAMDDVPAPNQWDDIEDRAERPGAASRRPDGRRRTRLWVAAPIAAALVVAALVVGAVALVRDEGEPEVAAEGRSGAETPTPSEPANPAEPVDLRCADGGLRSPSVPADAATTPAPSSPETIGDGRQVRTWRAGDLQFELLVPGLDHIDFVGERMEELDDPPATLLLRPDETRLLGGTGLVGPCDRYELAAAGGTEAERREALLAIAADLAFDPTLGVTDCGPLSEAAIQVTEGTTAMAAVRDIEPAGILLNPSSFGEAIPRLTHRPDGRCEVAVATFGGLRPIAIISGDAGTYGLDVLRGFAPDGFGGEPGTVADIDLSASVQIVGTRYRVDVDWWCDDCAGATLTIHYPDDDLTARASRSEPGPFTGDLPRPSTPGSHGWITVTWASSTGDGRGIWTTNVSSGDLAAG